MKCKTFHTIVPDAYEAGVMISENFADIQPEVIIFFSSIKYDFPEFFEAIYSNSKNEDIIVFGGTANGFYETEGIVDYGISALGINSENKIRWSLSVETGADADPFNKAQACAGTVLSNLNGNVDMAMVLADLTCDGVKVTKGVQEVLKTPFIGGLTGDDWAFKKGYVLANGNVYQNAVAILGMSGEFRYAINTASGWKPLGKAGIVEQTQGNIITRIDGKTAYGFVEEQFAIPPVEVALGFIPLAAYESQKSEHFFLRTPNNVDAESGRISYFGSIDEGTPVRVCDATVDDVLYGVNKALEGIGTLDFEPLCALVISCGARKFLLRDRVIEEINRVFEYMGKKIPLVGFPSYGEIGPFRNTDGSYTSVFFHNVSYVIAFLGAPK